MQASAAQLGLTERSQFRGYEPDPAEVLAESSIFVLSSRSEGFPRSILEAMRAGLPVVASDVGGVGEAVVDGETGILFPAGDAGALTAALKHLLMSPETRQRMGYLAHLRYQGEFSLERMVDSTSGLYATIVVVPPVTPE
jgi:glycosyltransferase involved in cell wall biosynthesis